MKTLLASMAMVIAEVVAPQGVFADTEQPPGTVIINVDIFDGKRETLIEDAHVRIVGKLIKNIGLGIADDADTIIDGQGGTLIPGLIDAHWNTSLAYTPRSTLRDGDISELAIRGAIGARATLLRGFTTIRDAGGNTFATKTLIDQGVIPGPRIYASGPPLLPTGGLLDLRSRHATPSDPGALLSYWVRNGLVMLADGVPDIIKRTREILRMGASQIMVAAGGGVSAQNTPVDIQEYTPEELKAIVEVAETWDTYVAAHVLTDKAAQTAIDAGVKSIEHGYLLTEDTLKMMKDKDVWLSIQPLLENENNLSFEDPDAQSIWVDIVRGSDVVYPTAKKLGVKIAVGTDIILDPERTQKQGESLLKLTRWFTPFEVLQMATSANAEMLTLTGPRNPYTDGVLGRIEVDAYADLIIVDGNPLQDLSLIADPDKNFLLIIKDGVVQKNILQPPTVSTSAAATGANSAPAQASTPASGASDASAVPVPASPPQ